MNLTNFFTIFADETAKNCVNTAIFGEVCDNCNGSAVMQILAYVVRAMTIGVGILAVIGIMVFGIRYLTSHGNENLAIKARRHLFQVLLGLVSYIILVLAASWILPGNLTTTMLGGNPGTCPESTKTDISVIGGDTDPTSSSSPSTDPSSPSSGWKSGTRPRECGPGTPGDFQTMTKQKDEDNKSVWVYTNSVGRTFFQYNQGDSRWGSKPHHTGKGSIASAGCCITTYAMASQSYSSGRRYVPSTNGDSNHSSNFVKKQSQCSGSKEEKIKCTIDQGGVVIVHAEWANNGTHWFLIVDYRINSKGMEFFALNTGSPTSDTSKWNGIRGSGWGTFKTKYYDYSLYYQYPSASIADKVADCKIR